MKRALAMALGAMMVAGSAAPASAASQIDFSGYYTVYYMNDVNLSKRNDNFREWDRVNGVEGDRGTMTDSFWAHRLNIDLVFRATDEISVHWRLRAPTFKRFGSSGYSDNDGQRRTGMVTHHVYGQIDQDWGTLRVGQIDDGFDSYGLGSLGYAPATDPMWTFVSPFDAGGRIEGVRYNNKWDNGFGLTAQYQKVDNNNQGDTAWNEFRQSNNRWSDQDFDRFIVEGTYEWDGGGAALGFRYDRDAAVWADGVVNKYQRGDFDKTNAWYINPAIMHSWGDFSVHFEGMVGWAETEVWAKQSAVPGLRGERDLDEEGYAFFLDADYNYGPGNVTLAGWWASGTDLGDGYGPEGDSRWDAGRYDKSKSLVSIDQGNFYPLLVAFNGSSSGWGRESDNAVAIANNAFNFVDAGMNRVDFVNDPNGLFLAESGLLASVNVDGNGIGVPGGISTSRRNMIHSYNNGSGSANHWAINLSGNHAFTDDISMHYALAYMALNNPNYRVLSGGTVDMVNGVTGSRFTDQDKDLGFEVDLGFSFQLLDNLSFVTSFGYMFSGDAYKSLRGYSYNSNTTEFKAVWDDADDSYVWYNTLTFSF